MTKNGHRKSVKLEKGDREMAWVLSIISLHSIRNSILNKLTTDYTV